MKNVYLVDVFHENGVYNTTLKLSFTSKAAAKRYADDCDYKTEIIKVPLISLSDF